MAQPDGIGGFFADEWARFFQGLANLSPEAQQAELAKRAAARARSGQPNTVSLPGWDDVIHLAPRVEPTTAQRTEYYAARRENRAPNIPADVGAEIARRRDVAQRGSVQRSAYLQQQQTDLR